eukprot:GHVU01069134.1.p2 GENE.GHVU01069134.1~~GHVU01069134.1.p2  ORF type:complete len:128 (+),score=6.98 GHVU01069134.1:630-1013(+)
MTFSERLQKFVRSSRSSGSASRTFLKKECKKWCGRSIDSPHSQRRRRAGDANEPPMLMGTTLRPLDPWTLRASAGGPGLPEFCRQKTANNNTTAMPTKRAYHTHRHHGRLPTMHWVSRYTTRVQRPP